MNNLQPNNKNNNENSLAAQLDELRANIETADSPESARKLLSNFIAQTTDNPVKSWLVEFQGIFNNFGAETGGAHHG